MFGQRGLGSDFMTLGAASLFGPPVLAGALVLRGTTGVFRSTMDDSFYSGSASSYQVIVSS